MSRDSIKAMEDFAKAKAAYGGPANLQQIFAKALGGEGLYKTMRVGGAFGMGAGVGLALVGILAKGLQQSKIANKIGETLGKALGLLIDMILLPFFPIFITVLMWLFKGIMAFGKWWREIWDTIKKEGLLGLIKLGIEFALITSPLAWMVNLVRIMLFGTPEEKQKVFEMSVSIANFLWGAFEWLLKPLLEWAFGAGKDTRKTLEFGLSFLDSLIPDWLKWLVKYFILPFPIALTFDVIPNVVKQAGEALSNAGNTASNWFEGFMSGGWIPHLAGGGYIGATGLAVVHKGETVVPPNKGISGDIHLHMYGIQFRTEEEMYQRVADRLRRDMWRMTG